MKKIFLSMMVSLDGYFEGPNHDIGWHNADDEFNEFALKQFDEVDGLIFGRRTYELMAGFWPRVLSDRHSLEAEGVKLTPADIEIAQRMDAMPKFVFSRKLNSLEWRNSRLIKENVLEEITKLKELPGRDMVIFGSSNLSVSLADLGLIDEYRIVVNPVLLGQGNPLLQGLSKKENLVLERSRTFGSGNILLVYRPKHAL